MSAIKRSNKTTALWALTAVVFLGLLVAAFVPGIRLPLIVAQVGFALLHGAQRYGWCAIGVFVAAGLVISNLLENLSIQTGFPSSATTTTPAEARSSKCPGSSARPTWPPATLPGSWPPCYSATCAATRPG
jgi:hypothetical protein